MCKNDSQWNSPPTIMPHANTSDNGAWRETHFQSDGIPLQNSHQENPILSRPAPVANPPQLRRIETAFPPIHPGTPPSPPLKDDSHNSNGRKTQSWQISRLQNHSELEETFIERRSFRWSRFSRRLSRLPSPTQEGTRDHRLIKSRFSALSRPLSFNGSIWVKNPEDFVIQFELVERFGQAEGAFDPPKHVLSGANKKRLVYLVSLAAMFSPLSSNIYFPALPTISEVLHTPIQAISLTISIYMIFQGLAPSFWGPLADCYGRRPILLSTLMVYLGACLGLALTPNFAILMIFRAVQAIGSSSTIAIGAGVIGDIAVAGERGGFMGLFGGLRMFGQAIGPVFGGALTQFLGFRSIFYFLLGLASFVVILLFLYLPETLPKIAGDGSRPLYRIYRPLLGNAQRDAKILKDERYKPTSLSFSAIFDSFKLILEKDVAVSLLFGGTIYTVWSMITSSTSTLFKEEYNLSEVVIGLCFLPNGLGCVLGSLITGKVMDRDYKHEERLFREMNNLPEDTEVKQRSYPTFPIEHARLRRVYVLNFLFVAATAVYGFSVEWNIAIPLTLQFITAFTATAIFNINSTLMIDLYPSKSASATAINNLVRCTLGSIGVTFVEKGISAVDEGPMFLLLACISGAAVILVIVERIYGPRWRIARLDRITAMLEQQAAERSAESSDI